jgi:hypothetical protein
MDERRRFLLLWKTLDRRRRGEIRRYAWLGRQASDPEAAWFVKVLAGALSTGGRGSVLAVGSLAWIALGAVTIVLIGNGVDRPFAFVVAILQILTGLLGLFLFAMYRRARRVNEPIAVRPVDGARSG